MRNFYLLLVLAVYSVSILKGSSEGLLLKNEIIANDPKSENNADITLTIRGTAATKGETVYKGNLFVDIPTIKSEALISIYNSIGQLVYHKATQNQVTKISLDDLNVNGLIQVLVFDGNAHSSYKVITL